MSLLERGVDDAFEDSLAYVKKQKLSCDYLQKVLQHECGGKIFPKSNIEGLRQQPLTTWPRMKENLSQIKFKRLRTTKITRTMETKGLKTLTVMDFWKVNSY